MPNYIQRVVNTFIKGLITEAGELTFPENASVDELNCQLFRDGSRRRRKAINLEQNHVLSSFNITNSTNLSFGVWENVRNNSAKEYVVIQVNSSLHFYDKTKFPYSSGEAVGFVDLTPFNAGVGPGVALAKCSFASILGNLVVVSPSINPFYIQETSDGVFSTTEITCRERDFAWLGDRTNYDEAVAGASVTQERKYDTYNCGWTGAALGTYGSNWPPLTHPWYSGKDLDGNFSKAEWDKIYTGSSLIGNGHFIYNVFSKDRSTESGVSNLPPEIEPSRFNAVAGFASRVWFAGLQSTKGAGRVYFSQILQDMSGVGEFLQKNDPTSEELSDILDDDGGVIVIPDASNIKLIYNFRNSIFIFADNGVWQITGLDNVFSPSAYSVSKVSEVGLLQKDAFTEAEGVPFWWSKEGIHTLQFDQFGQAQEQNLSINTIQSFIDNIDNEAKLKIQSAYDRRNKRIYWIYPNNGETITNKYNNALILDVALQAFYPWKVEDGNGNYIVGLQYYDGFRSQETNFNVVSVNSNLVAGGDIIANNDFTSPTPSIDYSGGGSGGSVEPLELLVNNPDGWVLTNLDGQSIDPWKLQDSGTPRDVPYRLDYISPGVIEMEKRTRGSNTSAGIYQEVPTVAGAKYQIRCSLQWISGERNPTDLSLPSVGISGSKASPFSLPYAPIGQPVGRDTYTDVSSIEYPIANSAGDNPPSTMTTYEYSFIATEDISYIHMYIRSIDGVARFGPVYLRMIEDPDGNALDSDGDGVPDETDPDSIVDEGYVEFNIVASLETVDGGDVDIVFFNNTSSNKMTCSLFYDTSFLDWGVTNFVSYAVGGYDFLESLTLKKTAPYIVTYLRETETGWSGTQATGYDPIRPSSLFLSIFWDYKKSPSSTAQQVYRRKPLALGETLSSSDFGSNETVVTSRVKCRGRGRSLRFRIESEQGKDFIYLGHGLIADVAGRF